MKNELDVRGFWFGAEKLPENQMEINKMVSLAYERGVMNFEADRRILEALKGYPRESYRLFASCDIYELHGETAGEYVEKLIAELGIDYLDCCHLAWLNESTAYPSFREEEHVSSLAELCTGGLIAKPGVLYSGRHDALSAFLEKYAGKLDYCAVRINYMDLGLEKAEEKIKIIKKHGLEAATYGITRNDLLLDLDEEAMTELKSSRPEYKATDWCVAYLKNKAVGAAIITPKDCAELEAYIHAFLKTEALSLNEDCILYFIAGRLRNIEQAPPCTDCHHCAGVCPLGLDVAYYVNMHTLLSVEREEKLVRQYASLPDELRASRCIACGQCVINCPKHIFTPLLMAELEEMVKEN